MNNMDYLSQITGSVQGSNKGNGGQKLLTPLMIKIIAVGVVLFVLLLVVGGMLGGLASKAADLAKQIDVRMTNLIALEDTYGKEVKSPKLRALGDTMNGVMTDTTQKLTALLNETEKFDVSKPTGKFADEEAKTSEELGVAFENAWLNGQLDEVFVREMSYQVTVLLSMESEVLERTQNEELQGIMNKSTEDLQIIQSNLNNL